VAYIAVVNNCININILLVPELQKHTENISQLLNLMARIRILIRIIFFRLIYPEYSTVGVSMSGRQQYMKGTVYPQALLSAEKLILKSLKISTPTTSC